MSSKVASDKEKIKLLVSFLDEENSEILSNITQELLSLDKTGNTLLKHILNDIDNAVIYTNLRDIIYNNDFRFFEESFLDAVDKDKSLFELLCIIATLEYPDLDSKAVEMHFDKLIKDIWLSISPEMTALDAVKQLQYQLMHIQKFEIVSSENVLIKELMINDVLVKKQTNSILLNLIYICIARAISLPIVPLKLYGLLFLAFENKPPYAINLFDAKYLFFIDNTTLNAYPESKVREKFNIHDDKDLQENLFSNKDLAGIILNWLSALYEKENNVFKAEKLKIFNTQLSNLSKI